jgi:hypothetical protein
MISSVSHKKSYALIMLSIPAQNPGSIQARMSNHISYTLLQLDSLSWGLKRFETAIQCGSQSHSLRTLVSYGAQDKLFELTAASSGRSAPFAILCFPALNFELRFAIAALIDPSPATSNARQSSSDAGWPSRREKNLCLKTALICSNVCVVYQPSRSCFEG